MLPIPEWESYPVVAWALLETPQGQQLAGVYVKRASVEVELGGLEFLGYQKPGEMLADGEIKKAAYRRVRAYTDQIIADREKTLANPPPSALTDAQITIWEEGFRASLSALDLPPHVQSRIANHLRHSKPSHHSPRVQFVAEVMKVDQYPYGWVTRLYTFDEWCKRVGDPDLGRSVFRNAASTHRNAPTWCAKSGPISTQTGKRGASERPMIDIALTSAGNYIVQLTLEQFRELLTVCRPKHFGVGQTGLDHLRRVFLGSPDLPQTAGRRVGWTG